MIVAGQIEIRRPPEAVFDFLIDIGNWRLIDQAVLELESEGRETEGRVELGTSGTILFKRPPIKVRSSWEVSALEPDSRLQMSLTGPGYTVRETVDITPATNGSRVAVTDEIVPTSFGGRLLVAISGRTVRKDLEKRSARLKELVERA